MLIILNNAEGHERTKTTLKSKFGKPNGSVNADSLNIVSLPGIIRSNQFRIHKFYQRLASNVQTLDVLRRLKGASRFVRTT